MKQNVIAMKYQKRNILKIIHNLEIDFIIDVNKKNIIINLSDEHSDYKWVTRDSKYLYDFIKDKLEN